MNNNYFGYPSYYNYDPSMLRSAPMYSAPVRSSLLRSSPLSALFGAKASTAPTALATTGAATKTFSWSSLLNGASKTLGVINQAIPVVYQIKPIWNNAKTMFRVAKSMNSADKKNVTTSTSTESKESAPEKTKKVETNNDGPTFFN